MRGVLIYSAILMVLFSARCAIGAESTVYDFNIPHGDAKSSLNMFAKQAGIPLLYRNQDLGNIKTNEVKGRYSIEKALDILLQDSGVTGSINQNGVLTISLLEEKVAERTETKSVLSRLADFILGERKETISSGKQNTRLGKRGVSGREIEEITVTGSRIVRSGLTTPTPVTSINQGEMEKLAPTTVIDALAQLPQFINSDTPQTQTYSTSGPAGASRINLRGIGTQRTLTLLDGRRIVPSTRTGEVNIALLPETLIKRIEMVTGGASAMYGSDAVSGVVNILMNTGFNGVSGVIEGGITGAGDNTSRKAGLMVGGPIGNDAHVVMSAEYYKADGVEGYYDRDWFNSWAVITNPDPTGPGLVVAPNVHSTIYTYGGLITGGPLKGIQFDDSGNPVPFKAGKYVSSITQSGGSGIDPGEDVYMLPNQERYNGFVHADYDLNEDASIFFEGLSSYSETSFEKIPVFLVQPWEAIIYVDNVFLPESIRTQMTTLGIDSFPFGRIASDADLGAGFVTNSNDMLSISTGFKTLFRGLQINGYYQYGRNTARLLYTHTARIDRVYRALDAVADPATGKPVCRSTLSFPNDGCIPVNMFGKGTPSQAAIDWITAGSAEQDQTIQQHIAEISAQRNFNTSWAGQLNVVTGISFRRESLDNRPRTNPPELLNQVVLPAALQGYRGLPKAYEYRDNVFERTVVNPESNINGSYDVWELFGDSIIPLYQSSTSIRKMDMNLAVRYADYQGSGGITAWKTGIEWQMFNDLRFRWTHSRDVRAGTLAERFDYTRRGTLIYDRENPGSSPYAISQVQGGNPLIDPEKSDTDTFGIVYQPYWLDGLSLSADYYDIRVADAISQPGAQYIEDKCFAGSTYHCALVHRNKTTGLISVVDNIFQNINEIRTRGVDIELNYHTPIHIFGGDESLSVRGFASYIDEASTTITGTSKIDLAGQTGRAGGTPTWQLNFSLGYANGPFSAYLQERYIDAGVYSVLYDASAINDNTVDPAYYTTIQLAYSHALKGVNVTLFAHINNLFDADPPLAPSWRAGGSFHTNESLFDVLGRRFSVGMRFSL